MPWDRKISPVPPDAAAMNAWEKQGYTQIQVVGPCPTQDPSTGQSTGAAYVVYLHRSVLVPADAARLGPLPPPRGASH